MAEHVIDIPFDEYKQYVNLLTLVQSFQLIWQRLYFADGHFVYLNSAKKAAAKLCDMYDKVYDFDKAIYNSSAIHINSENSEEQVRFTISGLKSWSENKEQFPKIDEFTDLELIDWMIKVMCTCVSAYLINKLRLEIFPTLIDSSMDGALRQSYVKWRGHVNPLVLEKINDDYLSLISGEDSIVIVADIRHSQDLVTYSPSAEFFRDKLSELIDKCRDIVKKNYGIFDRVTGDGFICYFNRIVCNDFNHDYYSCALGACLLIQVYVKQLFPSWISSLRKVPSDAIGLTLGLDCGKIHYSEKDGQLFAVGEAAVWATRMCSAGKSGDLVVNNIPYQYLNSNDPSVSFDELKCSTKTGEEFLAHLLRFNTTTNKSVVENSNGDQDKEL